MKDIHCHLLYGIDDGLQTLEEALSTLKRAEKEGITDIVLTPHYIENSKFNCNNKYKKLIFEELLKYKKEKNINVNLYLGNEVYFTDNILELIKKDEISTINNSKYVLIEFPIKNIFINTDMVIQKLISKGYIPILAHPERYYIFQNDPNLIMKYIKMGVLLQGNYMSLLGNYGSFAKKTFIYFIKNKYYSFIASDTHSDKNYQLKRIKRKILRLTKSENYLNDVTNNNFDLVINNKDMNII